VGPLADELSAAQVLGKLMLRSPSQSSKACRSSEPSCAGSVALPDDEHACPCMRHALDTSHRDWCECRQSRPR